jgi:hypothetical protein
MELRWIAIGGARVAERSVDLALGPVTALVEEADAGAISVGVASSVS